VLLALAGAIAACGEVGITPGPATISLGAQAESATVWTPTAAEPITLEVEVPDSVRSGAEVPITVRLRNGSGRPLRLGVTARRGFDVLVAQEGGRADSGAVWSPMTFYSAARDATVTDPLPAERDTAVTMLWPTVDDAGRRVPPGTYRVRATVIAELLSTRQLWTDWARVRVTP
jgi:hypothetical protein